MEEIFVFDDTGKYSGYNIILSLIHNKLSTTGEKKCIEKSRKEMPQIANSDDPGCQGYEWLLHTWSLSLVSTMVFTSSSLS